MRSRLTIDRYAANAGQLQCRMEQIDASDQSQEIQLEAFVAPGEYAEDAGQRQLEPGATGRARKNLAARQIVLADRGRWQRQMQFRYLTAKMGRKSVAVRTRPRAIGARVGIGRRGRGQFGDRRFGLGATQLANHAWCRTEPFGIRWTHVGNRYRRMAPVQVPTDNLVTRVALCARRLGGEPGMHRKCTP